MLKIIEKISKSEYVYKQEKLGHKTRLALIIMEEQLFENAKHSVQYSLSLTLSINISNKTISNNAGINSVPETMFQTMDNIQVMLAPAI